MAKIMGQRGYRAGLDLGTLGHIPGIVEIGMRIMELKPPILVIVEDRIFSGAPYFGPE
jgi:hypothetical protein